MKFSVVALLFLTSAAFAQTTVTPRYVDPHGGTVVHIRGAGVSCKPYCRITFGGIPSPNVTELAVGDFDAEAPAHAEGAATIVIGLGIGSGLIALKTIDYQFGYEVEREPVLVPIFTEDVPGPNGTRWASELWVHNDADHDVTLRHVVCADFIGPHDCGWDPLLVKAQAARKVPPLFGYSPSYVGGFLYPPRADSAQIHFDLRVVDAAHVGSGTAVPIVRDSEMHRAKLTMLNVPGDSARFRKRLRIYAISPASYAVRVYDLESGLLLGEQKLTVPPRPTDGGSFFVLNADAGGLAERLRVEVEPLFPPGGGSPWFWAFVSVTDNVTQQITVITPQ